MSIKRWKPSIFKFFVMQIIIMTLKRLRSIWIPLLSLHDRHSTTRGINGATQWVLFFPDSRHILVPNPLSHMGAEYSGPLHESSQSLNLVNYTKTLYSISFHTSHNTPAARPGRISVCNTLCHGFNDRLLLLYADRAHADGALLGDQ
jgi:hypothetical protein